LLLVGLFCHEQGSFAVGGALLRHLDACSLNRALSKGSLEGHFCVKRGIFAVGVALLRHLDAGLFRLRHTSRPVVEVRVHVDEFEGVYQIVVRLVPLPRNTS